jgi:hypothetical protein
VPGNTHVLPLPHTQFTLALLHTTCFIAVLIAHVGLGLKEDLLRAALDECLVTVAEAEALGFSALPDPFEPWPDVTDLMDMGE